MRRAMWSGVVVCVLAGAALGDTVTLGAIADATIFDNPLLAMGDAPDLFVGTAGDSSIRRALVRFDLSSIPLGAVVQSASLTLNVEDSRGDVTADLHRIISDWNEGPAGATGPGGGQGTPAGPTDVTFIQTGLGTNWAHAGGDFDPIPSDTQVLPTSGLVSFDVTSDVVLLTSGHALDFGWMLISQSEGSNRNARGLTARGPADGPMLTVTFIPTPGVAAPLLAAGLIATRRRRG